MGRRPKEKEGNFDWLEPAPVFVDHFSLQAFRSSGIVRMAFGEYVGRHEVPIYRIGLAMPISDAKALLETLGEAIREAEALPEPPAGPVEEEPEMSFTPATSNDI